jgi:hypothetical protein
MEELQSSWSAIYHPEWDNDPEHYLRCGFVTWGHSRRLARFTDPMHGFTAYIGLHHADPASWGAPDPARTRYFLSLFVAGKASTLRTYTTLTEARAALQAAYEQVVYSSATGSGRQGQSADL